MATACAGRSAGATCGGAPIEQEALSHIRALYAIEAEIRGRPPADRAAVRHDRARHVVDALRRWLETVLGTLSRKSVLADAIRYALGH